eukprot:TRINITY_DN39446_c0_g1_i4.p1 TRINITY_DN39446_c0_g1~~TRINITY_DN39446_c0_g1_i4.p1  ORF type:complete len:2236 (-),score=608.99 TRINITY_DN39446_c0_g1_i4:800-7507(-)
MEGSKEQLLMDELHEELEQEQGLEEAAAVIQRRQRGRVGQDEYRYRQNWAAEEAAALRVQTQLRARQAKADSSRKQQIQEAEEAWLEEERQDAAMYVQTRWRGKLGQQDKDAFKQRAVTEQELMEEELQHVLREEADARRADEEAEAATSVQKHYRALAARRERDAARDAIQGQAAVQAKIDAQSRLGATEYIQARYRAQQAKVEAQDRDYDRKDEQIRREAQEEAEAAETIQRHIRRALARKDAKELVADRAEREEALEAQEEAALQIQSLYRRSKVRDEMSEKKRTAAWAKKHAEDAEENAALEIQSRLRRKQDVRDRLRQRAQRQQAEEASVKGAQATLVIQSRYRSRKAREEGTLRQGALLQETDDMGGRAAVRIQAMVRGFLARHRRKEAAALVLQTRRRAKIARQEAELEKTLQMERDFDNEASAASLVIQARYRAAIGKDAATKRRMIAAKEADFKKAEKEEELEKLRGRAQMFLRVAQTSKCDGEYCLVEGLRPRGHPCWKRIGRRHSPDEEQPRWIVVNDLGQWAIAGEEAAAPNFTADAFVLSVEAAAFQLPEDMWRAGGWVELDPETDGYAKAPGVQVIAVSDPDEFRASAASTVQKIFRGRAARDRVNRLRRGPPLLVVQTVDGRFEGAFEKEHRLVNGWPIWKRLFADDWLFSSPGQRWMLGDKDEEEVDFDTDTGNLTSRMAHAGRLPDEMPWGCWLRFNERRSTWLADPGIFVREADSKVPEFLVLDAPGFFAAYSGSYKLVRGDYRNGWPFWKREDENHWLFSGESGRWFIGDEDEAEVDFRCDTGNICSEEAHEGRLPNEMPRGGWLERDPEDDEWFESPGIVLTPLLVPPRAQQPDSDDERTVEEAPSMILVSISGTAGLQCRGEYWLLVGKFRNGFPLWQRRDGRLWLFSGTDGHWLIGGEDEKQANFECSTGLMRSQESHNGLLPHRVSQHDWMAWHEERQDWIDFVQLEMQGLSVAEQKTAAKQAESAEDVRKALSPHDDLLLEQEGNRDKGYRMELLVVFTIKMVAFSRLRDEHKAGITVFATKHLARMAGCEADDIKIILKSGSVEVTAWVPVFLDQPTRAAANEYLKDLVVYDTLAEAAEGLAADVGDLPGIEQARREPNGPALRVVAQAPKILSTAEMEELWKVLLYQLGGEQQETAEIAGRSLRTLQESSQATKAQSAEVMRLEAELDAERSRREDAEEEIEGLKAEALGLPKRARFGVDEGHKAASTIQARYRAKVGLQDARRKKQDVGLKIHAEEASTAAALIQARFRGKKAQSQRDDTRLANAARLQEDEAATVIQQRIRRKQMMAYRADRKAEEDAAVLIQNRIRAKQAKQWAKEQGYDRLAEEEDDLDLEFDDAARQESRAASRKAMAESSDAWLSAKGRVPPQLLVESEKIGEGIYEHLEDTPVNGYPLWRRRDGKYWIYSGLSGQWFIGDKEERRQGFKCSSGFLASGAEHGGAMPDRIGLGGWLRMESFGWKVDPSVDVAPLASRSHRPPAPVKPAMAAADGPPPRRAVGMKNWDAAARARRDAPGLLMVKMPGGRNPHGVYELAPGEAVFEQPVWRRRDGIYTLYTGQSGHWYIATKEEMGEMAGIVRSAEPHEGRLPHRLPYRGENGQEIWLLYDSAAMQFRYNSEIRVLLLDGKALMDSNLMTGPSGQRHAAAPPSGTHGASVSSARSQAAAALPAEPGQSFDDAPATLYVKSSHGSQGVYTMLGDEAANGLPVWERSDGRYWLFASPDGRWFVGDSIEKERGFQSNTGYISSKVTHLGRMPHRMGPVWQRFDGSTWSFDKYISISAEMPEEFTKERQLAEQQQRIQASKKALTSSRIPADVGEVQIADSVKNYTISRGIFVRNNEKPTKDGQDDRQDNRGEERVPESTARGNSSPRSTASPARKLLRDNRLVTGADGKLWLLSSDADGAPSGLARVQRAAQAAASSFGEKEREQEKIRLARVPGLMYLVCPHVEAPCAGPYETMLSPHSRTGYHKANGFPVWKHRFGSFWIFSGPRGRWLVGEEAEYKAGFSTDAGIIASKLPHGGIMPTLLGGGQWARLDASAADWLEDSSILVMAHDDEEAHAMTEPDRFTAANLADLLKMPFGITGVKDSVSQLTQVRADLVIKLKEAGGEVDGLEETMAKRIAAQVRKEGNKVELNTTRPQLGTDIAVSQDDQSDEERLKRMDEKKTGGRSATDCFEEMEAFQKGLLERHKGADKRASLLAPHGIDLTPRRRL